MVVQVLSPLTISPRVSLCSNVLSSASENVFPQHLDWGSLTLLVVLKPPSRLATPWLLPFEKVFIVCELRSLLDFTW